MQQNPSDHETNEKKEYAETNEYPFIREVIKPTRNRRKILIRLLWIVGGAAAAGLIAACVFAGFYPTAEKLFGVELQKRGRISVASESNDAIADAEQDLGENDTDSSEAASGSTSFASGQSDPAASAEEGSRTETAAVSGVSSGADVAGQSDTSGNGAEPDAASGQETTQETVPPVETDPVEAYRNLQKELKSIAVDCEKAVVQVTGIKSEMDYFNASYENEQQVSGITIAEDEENYFILTENAPLTDAEKIVVRFANLQSYEAGMIRADANTGLAVIHVSKEQIDQELRENIQIAELGSSYSLVRGEPVIAVGSPMGIEGMTCVGSITSSGSDISMYDTHYHLYTTDINGTQSGSGVLVDLDGKVTGIIRQSLGTSGGSVIQALGISEITGLIDTLTNNEARPYAGIRGETVTAPLSEKTEIPQGVLIREVETDAPAMLAGLMQFDVIIKVNERNIASVTDYVSALSECKPGQDIHITALRKGPESYEEMRFQVLLTEI